MEAASFLDPQPLHQRVGKSDPGDRRVRAICPSRFTESKVVPCPASQTCTWTRIFWPSFWMLPSTIKCTFSSPGRQQWIDLLLRIAHHGARRPHDQFRVLTERVRDGLCERDTEELILGSVGEKLERQHGDGSARIHSNGFSVLPANAGSSI